MRREELLAVNEAYGAIFCIAKGLHESGNLQIPDSLEFRGEIFARILRFYDKLRLRLVFPLIKAAEIQKRQKPPMLSCMCCS